MMACIFHKTRRKKRYKISNEIKINPGEGGGDPTDPPLLYFYAPRVNETKLILFFS